MSSGFFKVFSVRIVLCHVHRARITQHIGGIYHTAYTPNSAGGEIHKLIFCSSHSCPVDRTEKTTIFSESSNRSVIEISMPSKQLDEKWNFIRIWYANIKIKLIVEKCICIHSSMPDAPLYFRFSRQIILDEYEANSPINNSNDDIGKNKIINKT